MRPAWLTNPLPRGLYGRAALILIAPVVAVQLVVSVVFIQRHFEGVTEQMTETVGLDLRYLTDEVNSADDLEAAREVVAGLAQPLALEATLPVAPEQRFEADARRSYDLSGRQVIATLRADVPQLRAVDLVSDRNEVRAILDTAHGDMHITVERRRVSASNPHQLLVWLVFTGALMTLVAYVFLRNQLRPIRQLARAAEAFGKGRTLPYKPRGAAEVKAAGRAFLQMRDRIERQIEQRTMMLSGVSHDLRTPLTRMRLELSMLDDRPEARALERDIADMERLLDAFLDFARGEALDDPEPTDPGELARTVATRGGQETERVELCLEAAQGMTLPLRPQVLARAIDNLLANALRYGARARLTALLDDGALRFIVEDDGPGIAPERRADALRPFSRLDAARNQDLGSGVGLGLTIAMDAARSHGGTLELGESADLGGLRAELILPN